MNNTYVNDDEKYGGMYLMPGLRAIVKIRVELQFELRVKSFGRT